MKINIKEIIDNWDPIDLFPYAPNDEYDVEIQIIEDFINQNIEFINVESLGNKIKEVFEKRFGSDVFKNLIKECREVAFKIIEKIEKKI